MSRGKIINKPLGRILFWMVCILLSLAILAAGSFSYARYVSSEEPNDSAGVANIGIEVFELEKYGQKAANIDYTQVVPGSSIPGPHIKLKINSEVSWSLFVKVTEYGFPTVDDEKDPLYTAKGNSIEADVTVGKDESGEYKTERHSVVMYEMSENWVLVDTKKITDDAGMHYVKTYKYNLAADAEAPADFVFKPSTLYDHTEGKNEIQLLMGDVVFISQYYGDYNYGGYVNEEYVPPYYQQTQEFGLVFEAYVRQVLG